MSAPAELLRLIERFEQQLDSYKSGAYNEAQLRIEFLDPFFKLLGWDMDNTAGYAEAYKDVIHEDAIRVGDQSKAPDYCFRIGGTRKFFLEAKKPSVFIKEEIPPAYQLRSYAWSAKLPLSILSDFEEFAFYDCRVKPKNDDSAAVARIFYCTFRDYPEKWDEIAAIFSREAILKGSFDKFVESTKAKKGTAEFDQDFLETIEGWRKELAQNLALRNPKLTQRELNFAVQRIIDRIIFLRICEARAIEDYGRLRSLVNGDGIYPRLAKLFETADARYNSGLFHFKKEPGRHEAPDELTLELRVDDKLLRNIIRGLYYPESPYHFSVVSADILGQVYEQFLGKVIRLTPGHHAVVEDKPEVKKAGGVYYTPTYIVDYIVQQTVGKLVEGRTPKQVEKLRILDPACGSGSFLIGAYQHLLDWHLQFYTASDPAKFAKGGKPALVQTTGGWKLTIAERKRILLNNIYGVDIDGQAVEVTKLSLLLKVLEGETSQSLQSLFSFFHERALPDLGDNIKCGNSLIGPDFYQQSELLLLTEEEKFRINVFDWSGKDGFPEIMRDGGFDAVIGNPPYGFHQIHTREIKDYFKAHYASSAGSFEHYFIFYEATLNKLRDGGFHGFIVPVTWLTIPSAQSLRTFVLHSYAIRAIAWLPELVFKNAQVNTLVSVMQKGKPGFTEVLISDVNNPAMGKGLKRSIGQSSFIAAGNIIRIFETTTEAELLQRFDGAGVLLGQLARPCSGYNPYEVGSGKAPNDKPHTKQTVQERPYHSDTPLGEAWKPEAVGRNLGRYSLSWPTRRFVKYGPWLAAARDPANFVGPRLLVQEITGGRARRIIATYCDKELYHSRDIIPIKCEASWPSPLFLLGVLNSLLITWRHHRRSPKAKKALFPKVLVSDLSQIPIPKLSETNQGDRARHDRMVCLVESMLDLHHKLTAAKTPHGRTALEREIAATDAQIDRVVYELYGLTEGEIKIVEGTAPSQAPPDEPTEALAKPKRGKPAYAASPPAPVDASLTPEKAHGDAAHYYSGKEDPLPYRTNSTEEKKEEP